MKQQAKKQPPPPKSDAALITLIAGALAMGKSVQATATILSPLIGIPVPTLLIVLALAQSRSIKYAVSTIPSATAMSESSALEPTYRGEYVLAASRRLQGTSGADRQKALQAERRYFAQHLEAVKKRRAAAAAVDKARAQFGDELGWHARLDNRTSPECREANGRNFSASRIPPIGWPGSVHPDCRCKPGRKFATSHTVYTVKSESRVA